MITTFNDEDSTEYCLASPDIENADQSADDESDNDLQLAGAVSSSNQGGVTSRGKRQDDKGDPRDSTKTRLKARGPRYGPVLRPEGSSDFYDSHLCCEYEYTGPYKKTSEPTSETRSPPVINKKVHHKKLAGKDQKVEEPATSFDWEGSTERPAKKPRTASSASVMYVQPLHSDNDNDHNLLLSTLTGGHGVFMAEAELDKIEDWYESDNDWYYSDNNLQIPILDAHGAHGISFKNLAGGYGAIFSDFFDEAVWSYFKPGGGETVETITSTIAELQKFGPGFMIWNSYDDTFEVYFGDAGMQDFQGQQGELPPSAQRNLTVFVDANAGPENLLDATRLAVEMLSDYRLAIEREMLQLVDFQIVDSGVTMHLVPVYIANAMMTPVPPLCAGDQSCRLPL